MKNLHEALPIRPSEGDFLERVDYVRRAKEDDEVGYRTYVEEIPQFARGEGDGDAREQFYPGWTDKDFHVLLEKLKGEGLI